MLDLTASHYSRAEQVKRSKSQTSRQVPVSNMTLKDDLQFLVNAASYAWTSPSAPPQEHTAGHSYTRAASRKVTLLAAFQYLYLVGAIKD
ncbi:hypothetical protein WISP_132395 [Willisornis vidua]|uniref:Uncharacterized protein n=1 Tax=Willisornis vidua TaxID=1566151 RepID=A0ABQ9CUB1_9PASS|nr:hypothetical protein WISP_132395 [Willisornis vidua]